MQSATACAFIVQNGADFFIGGKVISKEMLELGRKSSVIREIFEYSKKRKKEIGEDNVFDFSLGNPSIPAPEKFNETLVDLIKNTDPVTLHGYTSSAGDNVTREIIAQNIEKRYGFSQDPSLIYMTCGAAASLTVTLKAVLGKGEEVILLSPYFPEYKVFVENAGGVGVEVLCDTKTFYPDIEKLEKAIGEKTSAIIINSPNNPTGAVYPKSVLLSLASLLKRKSEEYGRTIYIIADEPYRTLVYDGVLCEYIPNIYPDTIVCTSYSKSLSIPGERIGYIAVSDKCFAARDLFFAVCGAGRSMGYVCAPSLFQRAAAVCDSLETDVAAYDSNRKMLYTALSDIGYECVEPRGAFYLFVKSPSGDAAEFCERAKKHEILIVPSDTFGVLGWARIAYCVSPETIKNSLSGFRALFNEYKENK